MYRRCLEVVPMVVEVVPKVEEVVPKAFGGCAEGARGCALYSGVSEWCAMCAMDAGGHALHTVPYPVVPVFWRPWRASFVC